MADDNKVALEFGAKTGELDGALGKLREGLQGLGEHLKGSFDPATAASMALGMGIERLGEELGKFVSEVVHEAIHAYAEWGEQVEHMQHRLGGSAESLSSLKVALDAVGVGQGEYEAIARRLPMILEQHADKFRAAGVAYADANGNLLSASATIQNINTYLQTFSAGAARNAAGADLMGRSYAMMADMVELTAQRQAEATEVAKQFGLTMSQYDLEATNDFNAETNLLHSALHGFYVTIGSALTPALTALATALRSLLVPAFDAFSVVVKVIGVLFDGLVMSATLVIAAIDALAASFELLIRLSAAAATALSGNFAGGMAQAKAVAEDYKKTIAGLGDMVAKTATDLNAHMSKPVFGGAATPEDTTSAPAKIKSSNQMGEYALAKAQSEAELALQREYLKEAQSMYDAAYADSEISTKAYYAAKLQIEETGVAASIAAKQKELQVAQTKKGKNEEEQLKFAAEQAAIAGQINVLEAQRTDLIRKNTVEYQNAEKARTAAMNASLAKEQQNLDTAQLDMDRSNAKQRLALHQMTAEQEFVLQRQMEERSLAITKEYLLKKRDADMLTSKDKTQTLRDYNIAVEEAEQKHQQKLTDIDHAATLERMKYSLQAQQTIEGSMTTMFEDIIKGTKSLSDAFKSFADSVISEIIRIQAQKLAASVMGQGTSGGSTWGAILGAIASGAGGSSGGGTGSVSGSFNASDASALGISQRAVGTNFVPNDMLTFVHRGERITPAVQNNAAVLGGGGQQTSVTNHFTVSGNVDARTQAQIATLAGLSIQRAMARNA